MVVYTHTHTSSPCWLHLNSLSWRLPSVSFTPKGAHLKQLDRQKKIPNSWVFKSLQIKEKRERKPLQTIEMHPSSPLSQVPAGSAQPTERFPCALASHMLQDFLSSRLEGVGYSAPCCGSLAKALSEEVRSLVRTVCHARYRLVCTVALGQVGQLGSGGMVLASRCLWDPYTDTCVSHTYQNRELFCTINVYAVYCE